MPYEFNIQKDRVMAIIPARSGSKGIQNKNIRLVAGYPLLAFSIAAASIAEQIDRIVVSTDSEDYAAIARQYGAQTPFIRPAEISGDSSTDLEFMEHLVNWLIVHEQALPEYFVHLRPTTPFREPRIIDEAILKLKSDPTATALRSAHVAEHSPFKWFSLNDEGYFQSIIPGLRTDEANNARQAYPAVYIPDGYVDVLKAEFIVKQHLLHGERLLPFVSPPSVDIDLQSDLAKIEQVFADTHSPVLQYLRQQFPLAPKVEPT